MTKTCMIDGGRKLSDCGYALAMRYDVCIV